jgi:hypothetical protein
MAGTRECVRVLRIPRADRINTSSGSQRAQSACTADVGVQKYSADASICDRSLRGACVKAVAASLVENAYFMN